MYKHQLLKNIEDNIEYFKGQEKSGLDEIEEKPLFGRFVGNVWCPSMPGVMPVMA